MTSSTAVLEANVANNETADCCEDDDTNSDEVDDSLVNFFLFFVFSVVFISMVDLSGEPSNNPDFLLLLSVILSTKNCMLKRETYFFPTRVNTSK